MAEHMVGCYDGTPVCETAYDPADGEPPAVAVVDAVAAIEGTDPLDLPPLYDHVDTEALNRLFEDRAAGRGDASAFSFEYGGWDVVVRNDGSIAVYDPETARAPERSVTNTIDAYHATLATD